METQSSGSSSGSETFDQQFAWEHVLAPSFMVDPYALTDEILEKCPPLFFSKPSNPQMGDGIWVATRFETIREVFQNNDRYSTAENYPYFKMIGEDLLGIPLQIDPPEHAKFRKLLEPSFSPRAVIAMEARIRAMVNRLIDGFVDTGECDVSYDFSRVYPVKIFMDVMGFPEEMFEAFLSWSHPMHFETDNPERMMWASRQALAYIRGFAEEVRAAPPNEKIASLIAHGRIDGRLLSDDELIGTLFFIWDGGMDTVAATSSLLFRRMALEPELQKLVRDNLDRMANAIEEFLRMNPSVNTARSVKVDHDLEGQQVKAGQRILCLIAAGNYDPDKYDEPRKFKLDRQQNRHLTFVAGSHLCLGINLARYELRIATGEFLRRIPTFRMRPSFACEATPGLKGAPHVPIVWDV